MGNSSDGATLETSRDRNVRRLMRRCVLVKSGCWEWRGAVNKQTGYGYFSVRVDGSRLAHRVAYTLIKGAIPDGLTIDHLCGNKRCVNVEHMEPVTAAENSRRGPRRPGTRRNDCHFGHALDPDPLRPGKLTGKVSGCWGCDLAAYNYPIRLRNQQKRQAQRAAVEPVRAGGEA